MGIRGALIFAIVCVTIVSAKPRHVEERQEYKYQTQSNGGGEGGQYEHYNADLSTWAAKHQEEVTKMADRLRSEYNSASTGVPATGQTYYSQQSSFSGGNQGGNQDGTKGGCKFFVINLL